MKKAELARLISGLQCKVIGADDAANDGHRRTLAVLARAFDNSESALLCEPSLTRRTRRPPDVVLIDPEVSVHVFEVKAMPIDRIDGIEAGGVLCIRYATGLKKANPIAQVRAAMFDIKDATARAYAGDLRIPFRYWVVFPTISRAVWTARFGCDGFCPPEFLFADDLVDPVAIARRLGATDRSLVAGQQPIQLCPLEQLQCVWRAFGDNSVLYATPEERPARSACEGTLGLHFDRVADGEKQLSDEQQRLSAMDWESGPRLVRGVAGSGKTVVLANNLARRLERMLVAQQEGLYAAETKPRLLAVCFNRSLAPHIERKVAAAYRQRTGRELPPGMVDVCAFNSLMWKLAEAGLWRYQNVRTAAEVARATRYLRDVQQLRERDAARLAALAYDAVYVDEGQDFAAEEFRLLKELCRPGLGGEPSLFVFYDDAQNLYGRERPNWQSLGLNVRGGRSYVMNRCYRNTRQVVEAALNVLYGTAAAKPEGVPTRDFGDITSLTTRKLVVDLASGHLRVNFAPREGPPPRHTLVPGRRPEADEIAARVRWMVEQQNVRPQDILILAYTRERATQLADAVTGARIAGIDGVHLPFEQKDSHIAQPGRVTCSTVASAKGYDAYCVLLASTNEFPRDVAGRASFYVGCTRAVEYLEILSHEATGLSAEVGTAIARTAAEPPAAR
jgi:hypothetical protein